MDSVSDAVRSFPHRILHGRASNHQGSIRDWLDMATTSRESRLFLSCVSNLGSDTGFRRRQRAADSPGGRVRLGISPLWNHANREPARASLTMWMQTWLGQHATYQCHLDRGGETRAWHGKTTVRLQGTSRAWPRHEAKMELGSVSRMWNQRRREVWVVVYFRARVPLNVVASAVIRP